MRGGTLLSDMAVQDADLLGRLNAYFDDLEHRLQLGQGWLIFNASRDRGNRIVRFMLDRLALYRPFVSYYHAPWRDFALHAYVSTIALPGDAARVAADDPNSPRRKEFALATSVASATSFQLAHADLVIVSNIRPERLHEASVLSQTAVQRRAQRRAVITLTPHDPWSLADAFRTADPGASTWHDFYAAMHASSLVAV